MTKGAMGNALNSSSYLVALATALSTVELETRRTCSSCGAVPHSPSADLAAALEAGSSCDGEAGLVRFLEADGVLVSEREGEITD